MSRNDSMAVCTNDTCPNCGATIRRIVERLPDYIRGIGIETCILSDKGCYDIPEEMEAEAIETMKNRLAEAVMDYIQIVRMVDWENRRVILGARIEVVDPELHSEKSKTARF